MAKTVLHQEIEAIAANRGALLLSESLISLVVLDSLERSVRFGKTAMALFPTGHHSVRGRFKDFSIDTRSIKAVLAVSNDGTPVVRITPDFTVTLELVSTADPALSFSSITLQTQGLELPVVGAGESIRFLAPVAPISATVVNSASRAAAILASNIASDDLLRVEGSVAFAGGARLVNSAIGEAAPVNLRQLFPAVSFSGTLALHVVRGSLLVVPEAFALLGNPGCPLGDAMDGVRVVPNGGYGGTPFTATAGLLPIRARQYEQRDGLAAVYFPKATLDAHFGGKATPAVSYRDSGHGFIGFEVELTCAIRGITVTIDPAAGGLRLLLDLATWGIVTANVDVPCVGRVDLAQIKFEMPKDNATAHVEALLRLAVDTSERLIVTSELTVLDLGEAKVDVQLFSRYLGFAGGEAAVVGFLIDGVLGRILANNLPPLVSQTIRDQVNQNFFVLAELGGLNKYRPHPPREAPVFSADADSALMGLVDYDPHN